MHNIYRLLFGILLSGGVVLASPDDSGEMMRNFGLQNEWWAGIMDYSWPIMSFVLGLVDGFNPCAMWTLFILLGFLLSIDDKKKKWLIGGIFIGSSGLIYMAALLTYLFGFKEITQMVATSSMQWVFFVIGGIAILTGILSFFSVSKKGVECDVRDAKSKQKFTKKIKEILEKEKLYLILGGVVILAFSVNAFELLCSFAIPTVFTATLISMDLNLRQELSALLIYDFAYILDDLVVFTIAIKTLSLKVFDKKLVQITHLIGAVLLILIGLLLIFDSEKFTGFFI